MMLGLLLMFSNIGLKGPLENPKHFITMCITTTATATTTIIIVGSNQPSWSSKLERDESGKVVQKDVLHMLSPNRPLV